MNNKKEILVTRPIKTVYHEGDKVIKVFNNDHPKSGVFNEALIHSYVEETGLPVPMVLGVIQIEGKWALETQYIPGKTLEQIMQENPKKLKSLMEQFVDIQIAMNKMTVTKLRNTKDKVAEEINSLKEIDASTRYELLQRLNNMPKHFKLVHGDFVPSNIIILKSGEYRIIDWSHATKGNASYDAANTYLQFSLTDEKKAELYLKIFSAKTDTAIQYVQKWLPIAAAAQLTKQKPEEKELLDRWISVAEYQ